MLVWVGLPRFEDRGPAAWGPWMLEAHATAPGALHLDTTGCTERCTARARRRLEPVGPGWLQVRGDLAADGPARGAEGVFLALRGQGRWIRVSPHPALEAGGPGTVVVRVPRRAEDAAVVAQTVGPGRTLEVRALAVNELRERLVPRLLRILLLTGWCGLAIVGATRVVRSRTERLRWLVGAAGVLLALAAVAPQGPLLSRAARPRAAPPQVERPSASHRSSAPRGAASAPASAPALHLAGFAVLGFGVATLRVSRRERWSGIGAVAVGSELAQVLVHGREPALADLGLDLLGAAVGLGVGYVALREGR